MPHETLINQLRESAECHNERVVHPNKVGHDGHQEEEGPSLESLQHALHQGKVGARRLKLAKFTQRTVEAVVSIGIFCCAYSFM